MHSRTPAAGGPEYNLRMLRSLLRTSPLWLCLVASLASGAQKKNTPVSDEPPTFYSVEPAYEYPHTFEALNHVDFRNIEANLFDRSGHVERKAKLKDGMFISADPSADRVELTGIWYLDFDEQAARHVLINLSWLSNGKHEGKLGVLQLFRVANHRLEVQQQIAFTARHPGAGATLAMGTGTLAINSSHYKPIDPNCCPSAQDLVLYRWSGEKFVQTATETKALPKTGLAAH